MNFLSEYKIKFINETRSRYYSYYINGFPRSFIIYDILPVQNLMSSQRNSILGEYLNDCITSWDKCELREFEESISIRKVFSENLLLLKETAIASASDFLCLINYE